MPIPSDVPQLKWIVTKREALLIYNSLHHEADHLVTLSIAGTDAERTPDLSQRISERRTLAARLSPFLWPTKGE